VKLIEALEILEHTQSRNGAVFRAGLACGFTPLHFETFLRAHLSRRFSGRRVHLDTGLFGDLIGNVERLSGAPPEALIVAIEWQDLDARLGIRALGGWRAVDLQDMVTSVGQVIDRLQGSLSQVSGSLPICISAPTLPLPPLFTTSLQQASAYELQIRRSVASFASSIAEEPGVRVLSLQLLDELSPLPERLDVRSEVQSGFPYKLAHASTLAGLVATLVAPSPAKKALITDLDDTLWAGILGEAGPEGISWSLEQRSHLHGIYQQFLESLASAGILIAVASKNEKQLVDRALERPDLRISAENIYPVEANWSRKSESIDRILRVWNIGADAVVFLDDSPMEVAEVKEAFPEMDCLVFPARDYEAFWTLLKHLREAFGKGVINEEDHIRMKSIRGADTLRAIGAGSGSLDDFLQAAAASMKVQFTRNGRDNRAFELLNKTNQFNLNGKRLTESEWSTYFEDPSAFLMTVTYEDKYGPLGKIAAVLGRSNGKTVQIDFWVMSCRAFSRRIEHQTLRQIFEKFGADEICFDYQPTSRNTPLQEFLAGLLGALGAPGYSLSLASFSSESFELFQHVEEIIHG